MELYPLTRPQQQIYALERYAGGAGSIAASILFRGTLDAPAMQQAMNLVVETNDALRLCITAQGKQYFTPYQTQQFPLMRFDSLKELHAWCAAQALESMDIAEPLYRAFLLEAEGTYGALAILHHMIADAWTCARFGSLLHTYYQGILHSSLTPQESPSYKLFIEKEASYLQSPRYAKDRAYWLEQFPPDRAEPTLLAKMQTDNAIQSTPLHSESYKAFLSPDEAAPLRAFAQANQISMFQVLLTALGVYLYRLRGQRDICIGTTTLGRTDLTMKKIFGMFVTTLPLMLHLEPAAGLAQNAGAFKQILLSAIRHEGFGYQDLLAALKARDGFGSRLYDVLFNYQNAVVADTDETFLGTYWYHGGKQAETLQVQASDRDRSGGLHITYNYHTSAFDLAGVKLLHERLMALLLDGIAHPEKPLDQLNLLCEADRAAWDSLNQSKHAVQLRPIHRLFEEQAAKHPGRTAIICESTTCESTTCESTRLTYQELNNWANRIAAWLRGMGIAAHGVVALRMERCPEMMPLLLGIMKAGCAYLPISPAWPEARTAFALQDAQAAALICQPEFAPAEAPCPVFSASELHNLPAIDQFQSSDDISALAYIMYTSGSTGQPKGVRLGQAALCNRLLWQNDVYPLSADETLIQKTNYAFDVSAWELFCALIQGRTLLLPEPGAERQPRRLAEVIRQHSIETIHFVPSMLAVFLDDLAATKRPLPSLRRVIVSGEALTPALNQRFYTLFAAADTKLVNLYGPTECAVDVLYYNCGPEDTEIPIGKPVWNTEVYVLDAAGRLLPPGETGELCVAGVQLAQGYANPALNADRFIDHERFGMIYRTGDLCSLQNGQIHYHGRNDSQVKIRGQRVELAEIERQLEQVPGIARAAVYYDNTRLHAFYSAKESQVQNAGQEEFLTDLRARLPIYMLPDSLRRVTEFPLNANGKLDRKRLAEMAKEPVENSRPAETRGIEAKNLQFPQTETERQIIAAVKAQLGTDEFICMDDTPGRCGLSSLDIVSISLALEAQGLLLSVNDFYIAQDFKDLAARAELREELPLLHRLQTSEADSDIACVGIPYGGGSFSAWADVARLQHRPFYAAQHAHINPQTLLKELRRLPHKRFVVLGACVGSGLATQLASLLEAEGRLAGLVIAASVPPALVRLYGRWYPAWKLQSAAGINRALQKLSRQTIHLGRREIKQLQDDAAFFLRYLASARHVHMQAPVRLVYGEDDPMLQTSRGRKRWERFFGKSIAYYTISAAKHDITHTHARDIAELMCFENHWF